MMKFLIFILFASATLHCFSQTQLNVGKVVQPITLKNVDDKPYTIVSIGKTVVSIFYSDPDAKDVNEPLSEAIKLKKYNNEKYNGIGIGNCADTWLPNSIIRYAAKEKEKKYPGSIILIDNNHLLAKAWGLDNCNDVGVVIIIGLDKKVKFIKYIKSQEESQAAIPTVLKIIDEEIKNHK